MSNTPELLQDAIPDSLYLLNLSKDAAVVSLTYLFMDVVSTFDEEVALMWPSRLTFMKTVYLVNRYTPFIDASLAVFLVLGVRSTQACREIWIVVITFFMLGLFASETIIVVRALAIWNFDKFIVVVIALVTGGGSVASLVALTRYMQTIRYPGNDILAITGCVIGISDHQGWSLFLVVLVMESVLVAVTIFKLLQTRSGGRNPGPVINTMFRDGLIFYVIMMGFSVANICCMLAAPPAVSSILQLPLRIIHSTLCSRVLLNLRQAALRTSRPDFTIESTIMFNAMNFESCRPVPIPVELQTFDEPDRCYLRSGIP